jgi:hypothetical protein
MVNNYEGVEEFPGSVMFVSVPSYRATRDGREVNLVIGDPVDPNAAGLEGGVVPEGKVVLELPSGTRPDLPKKS